MNLSHTCVILEIYLSDSYNIWFIANNRYNFITLPTIEFVIDNIIQAEFQKKVFFPNFYLKMYNMDLKKNIIQILTGNTVSLYKIRIWK